MPASLDALPKGHEMPASTFVLSSDWVRNYIEAVEDEATPALSADLVPPLAVAALSIRALLDGARLPPGALHLGQELAFLRPIRAGERLSASAKVAGRGERQGWLLMSVDLSVQDEGGQPVMAGRARVAMPAGPAPTAHPEAEEGGPAAPQQAGDLPSLTKRLSQ